MPRDSKTYSTVWHYLVDESLKLGAEWIAQHVIALAALAEDQSWFPAPTLGGSRLPVVLATQDLTPSFSFSGQLCTQVHMIMQAIQINKKLIMKNKTC